jgi:glyoxylase-like metal-dependent hydrolase (beta-lactamase superfamily II)
MAIHHLNCGTMRPYFPRIRSLVYCLLVETNDGLLLVDTGFGTQDYLSPTPLMRTFTALLRTPRDLAETALHQIQRLGHDPADLRHIVMTHMHIDHAGGLPDFPQAAVHIHEKEHQAIMHPKGWMERFYVQAHWRHGPNWKIHEKADPESWFGFDSILIDPNLVPEVRLIPLHGHSRGHCGVAIKNGDGWLLHCGDATYPFYHAEESQPPDWLARWLLGRNTPRLKALYATYKDEITLISSHDLVSYLKHRDR